MGRTRVYHLDRARLALVRDWLAWFFKDAHQPQTERTRK
jgi:hypothetical protein